MRIAALLAELESISRERPDRVLRLRGEVPVDGEGHPCAGAEWREPFELLIFRGFSSSVSHPTGFDPDVPALPEGTQIREAELLAGPLNPSSEQRIAGPEPVERFRDPAGWA
jgi:hypothetical protein